MPDLASDLRQRLEALAYQRNTTVDALIEGWLDEDLQHKSLPRQALELAVEAVILVNEAQEAVFFNQGASTIFGYTPEEIIGKPLELLIPPEIRTVHRQHIETFAAGSEQSRLMAERYARVMGIRKDGTVFPCEVSISKIYWHDELYLMAILRDVTRRKSLEEDLRHERDLISKIMDTSPSAITVVDKSGQIVFANARAEEKLGINREEITERTFDDVQWRHTDFDGNPFPDDLQPFVQVMTMKAPVHNIRHAIEWDDGRKVYLSINGAPMFDDNGEISQVVFTIEDVTFQKQIEDELVAALANERALNEVKSLFMSFLSHEFRTPMTVILNQTGLLRLKLETLTEQEIVTRLNNVDYQVKRLTRMVDEVSFIGKSQTQDVLVTPVIIDIKSFLQRLVEEIHIIYSYHQVTIHLEIDSKFGHSVSLDETLLDHIFVNLLGNAVKYSPDGGEVTVSCVCRSNEFEIVIQDHGMGIPTEDQARLFDTFYRASNVNTIPGTGLGLAVVKQAVDAHGGTISFESVVGHGTTFTVILPYLDQS